MSNENWSRCPRCNSNRVQKANFTVPVIIFAFLLFFPGSLLFVAIWQPLWILSLILPGILILILLLHPGTWECQDCKLTWPIKKSNIEQTTQKPFIGLAREDKPQTKFNIHWFIAGVILVSFLIYQFVIVPSNQKFTADNPVESARLVIGNLTHERGSGFVKGDYNTGQLDIVYAFFPPKLYPGTQSLDEAISKNLAPLFKKLFKDNSDIQDITFLVLLPYIKDGARAWAWQLDTSREKIYWKQSFFLELSRQEFNKIDWNNFNDTKFTEYVASHGLFLMHYPTIYETYPNLKRFTKLWGNSPS